ncbi:hypothetical protein [Streptomyces sp. NPDC020983]|uniref:hypothetical protein n=1 Tax=Streptomyces sp. NPDC020983 TaxID=3365106 RepID=UPI0037929DE5
MRYSWRRTLRPLPAADGGRNGGLLDGRTAADTEALVCLDELRDAPVVVVLGERGAGKTVALQQERDLLSGAGADVAPLLHLGRDVFDAASASSALHELLGGGQGWPRYVLLDGLDEGLNDIPGLAKVLLKQVKALDGPQRDRLRLRIICRTTRWPEDLEDGLRELWPDPGQIRLMTLVALTRQDVRTAALERGIDGTAFIERVVGRGVEALTEQPVTLNPLLKAQADGEELPETVAEAYDQACRMLLTETWPQGFTQSQERPAIGHLMEVARWAAAALQFSRCPAITDREPVAGADLHLDDLSGASIAGPIPGLTCSRRELLHLTESGLFTAVGSRRWTFAHRSYQEHLAAQYLCSRIAPQVREELLWAGSGPARHILPEHQEVAAHLAAQDRDLFEELFAHDPVILLLADLPSLPASDRQRVTQALLDAVPEEGFERFDYALLAKLDHPGLAEQLAPFLTGNGDSDRMYLALWTAAQCRPAGMAPALLTAAKDAALPVRFRSFALNALSQVESGDTLASLRDLAADPNARVATAALEQLWPQHLTLVEYLDALPARPPRTYRRTMEEHLDAVGAEHLDDALGWSMRTLQDRHDKSLIATALLGRCIRLMDQQENQRSEDHPKQAAQALVALAAHPEIAYAIESRPVIEYLCEALHAVPSLRQQIAGYVLRHGSQDTVMELTFTSPDIGLFPQEDLLYWARQWADLTPEARRTACPLFDRRPRPDEALLRAAVEAARRTDAELLEATSWWDAPPPDWQLRRQQREEERRRRDTFDAGQFAAALEAVHTAEPKRVRAAWGTVVAHLYRTHDGHHAEQTSGLGAATAAPSCPSTDSALGRKLVAAARHVLATAPVWSAHQVAAWGTEWSDTPELAAMPLALDGDWQVSLAADVDRWAGWALALATMGTPAQDRDLHQSLFRQCTRRAGAAFESALAACLDRLDTYRLTELVRFLHRLAADDAVAIVRDWATAGSRSDSAWEAVVTTLSALGDPPARGLVKDTVAAIPPRGTPAAECERWIAAAQSLMYEPDLRESWPHIRTAFADPQLCDEVMDRTVFSGIRWPAGISELDEADLGDLYARLCHRDELKQPLPIQEPGIAYRITRQEDFYRFAESLLRTLAGHGTPQAADELNHLATSTSTPDPQRLYLRRLARRTARKAAQHQSAPLPVPQLHKLTADHSLRVVTDEAHLLNIVMEALDLVQEALSGPNGMATLLWNRASPGRSHMWPMWEEDLSDLVAGLLKIHLAGRHIVINREVQVDRPGLGGGRTDIHIQATDPAQSVEPITVVIEAKGCWNRELPTALDDQLVARYLRRPHTAGIYLVGFFDCDLWQSPTRRPCTPSHTRQEIEHEQQNHAAKHDVLVRAVVLDCRPPGIQTA